MKLHLNSSFFSFSSSSCQFPLRFSRLSLNLSNQAYNPHCMIVDGQPLTYDGQQREPETSDGQQGDLFLKPWEVALYKFQFVPLGDDIGKKLEASCLIDM